MVTVYTFFIGFLIWKGIRKSIVDLFMWGPVSLTLFMLTWEYSTKQAHCTEEMLPNIHICSHLRLQLHQHGEFDHKLCVRHYHNEISSTPQRWVKQNTPRNVERNTKSISSLCISVSNQWSLAQVCWWGQSLNFSSCRPPNLFISIICIKVSNIRFRAFYLQQVRYDCTWKLCLLWGVRSPGWGVIIIKVL